MDFKLSLGDTEISVPYSKMMALSEAEQAVQLRVMLVNVLIRAEGMTAYREMMDRHVDIKLAAKECESN